MHRLEHGQSPSGEVQLSPEDEADLLEAMAEADRGESISAEELFARLDRNPLP